MKTGPVLTAIGELDATLAERTHPLLGRGSVHASLIEGGAEMSSYPARCTIGLERRTLPGETAAQTSRPRSRPCRPAGANAAHDPARPRAVRGRPGGRDRAGGAPRPRAARSSRGAPYWADAAFIAAAGIPTVMYGASGAGAHAAEEWVSVDDTIAVTETLIAVARRICG